MATEPDPSTDEATPDPSTDPPPQAVDRLKRERDEATSERDQLRSVAQQALLVDKVYEHLVAKEDLKVTDRYALAKRAAAAVPDGTENPLEAVDAWLKDMSTLFSTTPSTPPAPAMAAGGDPASGGEPPDSGPFPVNSKEFKEYEREHGWEAALAQIRDGMFYFSDANEAAQATARSR